MSTIKTQRRNLTKSRAHYQEAVKHLPLGVSSYFRFWG
jgi:glutamate-1-semialdehyde 2,1-aminomutase